MSELITTDEILPLNEKGEQLYNSLESYKKIVGTNPKNAWVKANPYANNAKYLPIGITEELLSKIFPFWQVEQHGEPKLIGNSVVISVNLKVYHPILGQWLTYSGIGAVPVEVQKGAHPTDWTKINSKALHKNVPAAMSFAVNNAAKKIGKLFGSHLNRNETL
ncbi:hypothetical protein [Joostella sp. CR20]|uniref:hypothetical protein n=1 Tax=Joostella sp. CR20 TaxID=2804312 RepID=UPI00313E5E62